MPERHPRSRVRPVVRRCCLNCPGTRDPLTGPSPLTANGGSRGATTGRQGSGTRHRAGRSHVRHIRLSSGVQSVRQTACGSSLGPTTGPRESGTRSRALRSPASRMKPASGGGRDLCGRWPAEYLSWGREDGIARVWDAKSGAEIARQTHPGGVAGAVFAADGRRVLSWGVDGTARVWTQSRALRSPARHTKTRFWVFWVSRAQFSRRMVNGCSHGPPTRYSVWDARSGAEIAQQTHAGGVEYAIFAADGQRVLSWSYDHTLRVWNARSGTEISRQTHQDSVMGAVFLGDGQQGYSPGASTGQCGSGTQSRAPRSVANHTPAALTRRSLPQVTAGWSSGPAMGRPWYGIRIRAKNLRVRSTRAERTGAEFAADGQRVLTWGLDGTARVWDATTGAEIARQTHPSGVAGALFAADGLRVLSWARDGTARVWNATSNRNGAAGTTRRA